LSIKRDEEEDDEGVTGLLSPYISVLVGFRQGDMAV
jgi:hypothetical protein